MAIILMDLVYGVFINASFDQFQSQELAARRPSKINIVYD